MAKYIVKIEVKETEPAKALELGNLLQFTVDNIDRNDFVKLLTKVKQNPGIVKTALKFI